MTYITLLSSRGEGELFFSRVNSFGRYVHSVPASYSRCPVKYRVLRKRLMTQIIQTHQSSSEMKPVSEEVELTQNQSENIQSDALLGTVSNCVKKLFNF